MAEIPPARLIMSERNIYIQIAMRPAAYNMQQTMMFFKRFFRFQNGIYSFLIVIILFSYSQVLHFDYVNLDDDVNVYENKHIQSGFTLESIKWAFTSSYWGTWQPMVWLSFMLNYRLHGISPGWFHLTNVFLHFFNTLLLYFILKRMTGFHYRSAFVACIFAIHPIHVESVAWITERKDVLSTFWGMLSIWCYIRYTENRKILRYVPVFLFMGFSLMAKPMLVTLPFVLLLFDYWPLKRMELIELHEEIHNTGYLPAVGSLFSTTARRLPFLILEKIPLFLLSVLSCIITVYVSKEGGAIKSLSYFPITVRISNALVSYVAYLQKIIWPFDLIVFYPHPGKILIGKTIVAIVLLVSFTLFVLRKIKDAPWLFVGWFIFIGTLLPVIGIVQLGGHAMADRFVYFPSIGVYIIIAWGVHSLTGQSNGNIKSFLAALTVCFLLILAMAAWKQVGYWRDSETLFKHALSVSEDNYIANNNYGIVLRNRGKTDDAIKHFKKAIANKGNYVIAMNNLGVALESIGKPDPAIFYYQTAIQINPNYPDPYVNLAFILLHKGQYDDAFELCNKALNINPELESAYSLLGDIAAAKGDLQQAISFYNKAIEMNPSSHFAHNRIGAAFLKQDRFTKAITHFREALRYSPHDGNYQKNLETAIKLRKKVIDLIDNLRLAMNREPDNLHLRIKLGKMYKKNEQYSEAIALFQQILNEKPDAVAVLLEMALIYTEKEDNDMAIQYFMKLNALDPGNEVYLYNIACLYARQGMTHNAMEWLQKAVDAGYQNRDQIVNDPDLSVLKNTNDFKKILQKLSSPGSTNTLEEK